MELSTFLVTYTNARDNDIHEEIVLALTYFDVSQEFEKKHLNERVKIIGIKDITYDEKYFGSY